MRGRRAFLPLGGATWTVTLLAGMGCREARVRGWSLLEADGLLGCRIMTVFRTFPPFLVLGLRSSAEGMSGGGYIPPWPRGRLDTPVTMVLAMIREHESRRRIRGTLSEPSMNRFESHSVRRWFCIWVSAGEEGRAGARMRDMVLGVVLEHVESG